MIYYTRIEKNSLIVGVVGNPMRKERKKENEEKESSEEGEEDNKEVFEEKEIILPSKTPLPQKRGFSFHNSQRRCGLA